jgi:hypothetical protein
LNDIKADEVLVPIVAWNQNGELVTDASLGLTLEEAKNSLEVCLISTKPHN